LTLYPLVHHTDNAKPKASPRVGQQSPVALKSTDEDYVYDIFYFALRDVNDVNELMAQESANIGTVYVSLAYLTLGTDGGGLDMGYLIGR
jgi:hypothetical protein